MSVCLVCQINLITHDTYIDNDITHTPGNISVLEFFSIESSLKAISSDYGSNKERNVRLEMRID